MFSLNFQALIALASSLSTSSWEPQELNLLAARGVAARGGRANDEILHADGSLNDAYWRLLSLLDPLQIPVSKQHFGYVYVKIRETLTKYFSIPPTEAQAPARILARAILEELDRLVTG